MTAHPLEKQKADIRTAWNKANPEIVELKFGCRLLEEGTDRSFTVLDTIGNDPISRSRKDRGTYLECFCDGNAYFAGGWRDGSQ